MEFPSSEEEQVSSESLSTTIYHPSVSLFIVICHQLIINIDLQVYRVAFPTLDSGFV